MRLAPRPHPRLFLLLLTVVGCASAGSTRTTRTFASSPDFIVRETRSHYPVHGTRASQMGASLEQNAPRKNGLPAFGLTRWSLSWRFELRRSAGSCQVVSPEVTADLELVLPRWSTKPPVEPALSSRWQAFLEALREHEEGHRRLVLEAGHEIANRLRRTSGPNCRLARHQADRAARKIAVEYDRRNLVYDKVTRGGRVQGVQWP